MRGSSTLTIQPEGSTGHARSQILAACSRANVGAAPVALAILLTTLAAPARAETIEEKAAACAACHGENGVPPDKTFPVIWGPFVEGMERDDMMALAAYFSKKPWPDLRQPLAPDAVVARAVRTNTAVGCTGCHLAQYQGDGTQPRLAGQTTEYLAKSMLDFRTQKRGNNPGMSDLMKATSEDDIKAMAEYLAGL